ncbi:hypothetical protein [uncultured Hoeflea sp.]|uniref:hypothetical protein n=1 Tax=uncultured Hoeflea sp. TaxID=538666 RepID=UPI00261B456A|nr:hypothetical protein [uncultured Hoeflea sp.]
MTFKLSAYERKVRDAVLTSGFAEYGNGELPSSKPGKHAINGVVRAKVIRHLFLAIPLDGEATTTRLRHGLHLKGLWIRGTLNLAGLNRGFDREAPPAIFENCHFEGDKPKNGEPLKADIVLTEGHFAKLSFSGSRFVDLVADNVIVNGPVDLSGVSSAECFSHKNTGCRRSPSEADFDYPLTPEQPSAKGKSPKKHKLPRCAANFSGARIRGEFRASHATMCVLPKDKAFDSSAGKRPYALKLTGSRISGSVVLQPKFSAHGGVALSSAHVDETIWMQGIRCSAEWDTTALDFGYTKCGGIISLRSCERQPAQGSLGCDRVLCHGMIDFYGAETVGEVHLGGGCHTVPFLKTGAACQSISFFQAKIGGLIRLTEDEEHVPELGGALMVQNANAGGLAILARMPRDEPGISGVEQSLWLANCRIQGDMDVRIQGATAPLDAPLFCSCASNQVSGDFTFCGADSFRDLDLSNVVCGGAMRVSGEMLPPNLKPNALDDKAQPPPARDAPPKLASMSLKNGRVEGMLLVGRSHAKVIELRNCRVGGNAKLQGLRIYERLDASNMRIDGECQVKGVVADALDHTEGQTGSDVQKAESHRPPPLFNFMGTRIAAALEFSDLDYQWTRNEPEPEAIVAAFKAVKALNLPFYPGYTMIEAVTPDGAHTSYLWDERSQPVHLDGTSPPIHAFNERLGDRLKIDATTAADYLRFFCSVVWGEEGWFRIPFDENGLLRYSGSHLGEAKALAATGAQIVVTPDQDDQGAFLARNVPVIYAWNVFVADFKIMKTGMVEMLDDDPKFALEGACPISFKDGYRRYNPKTIKEVSAALWRKLFKNPRDPIDIVPGDWTALDKGEAERFVDAIRKPAKQATNRSGENGEFVTGVRELGFYPGWALLEAQSADDEAWRRSYLWNGEDEFIKLDGTSPPIHALNQRLGPKLDLTTETAAEYLRFFCHMVWGDNGWFRLPQDAGELDRSLKPGEPSNGKSRSQAKAGLRFEVTREVGADGESVFVASGVTVIFGNAVFVADFRIAAGGQVEMTADTPLFEFADSAPIIFEQGTGRRRVVGRDRAPEIMPMPAPWSEPTDDLDERFKQYRVGLSGSVNTDQQPASDDTARQEPEGLPRVNLGFVECSYLNDAGGQAWRRSRRQANSAGRQLFQLNLDNFRYALHNEDPESLGVSADFDVAAGSGARQHNQWEARRDWLKLQYLDDNPKDENEFNVQPYEHIAQLFRRSGRAREAAEIIHDRMSIESGFNTQRWKKKFSVFPDNKKWITLLVAISAVAGVLTYLIFGSLVFSALAFAAAAMLGFYYPVWSDWFYRHPFYYGLSPVQPTVVFVLLILAGSVVTQIWQSSGVLIYDEMPVELRADARGAIPGVTEIEMTGEPAYGRAKPCGDQINVPLYAVDTFVPLIDLKQEMRCRPDPKFWYWQMAKSVYTALGWIVTSMLILAVSGLIRRRSEG